MPGDKIKNSDKGKSIATSEQKSFDYVRSAAKRQEKLELDATRRFLPGGMNEGPSRQQETTGQQRKRHQKEQRRVYKAQVKEVDKARSEKFSQDGWDIINKAVNDTTKELIEKQQRESEES